MPRHRSRSRSADHGRRRRGGGRRRRFGDDEAEHEAEFDFDSRPRARVPSKQDAEPQEQPREDRGRKCDDGAPPRAQRRRERGGRRRRLEERPSHPRDNADENNNDDGASSGAESSHDEALCVRIGVEGLRRPLTREMLIDEMDAIRLAHRVVHIVLEGRKDERDWGRIYFRNAEDADECITELNIPLRQSKWRNFVSQRLPLPGPQSGDIGTIPAFVPHVAEPADTIAVDTQEGYVFFSTDELYRTKGSEDYMTARRAGKIIRRLLCKHFDPEIRHACRYGADCQFIHVKAFAMDRLLRATDHRSRLRRTRNEEDIQVSLWEFARRHDTLVIRNLDHDITEEGLRYMFETCPGFKASMLRRRERRTYGIIRFNDRDAALTALLQTYGSNLNIGFYGAMEDLRFIQLHDSASVPTAGGRLQHSNGRGTGPTTSTTSQPPVRSSSGDEKKAPVATAAESSPSMPAPARPADTAHEPKFPPLPEGWSHGISRRTGEYFFYHLNDKNKTTWKHPETKQTYSSK